MIDISVVIPLYNKDYSIQSCIASVLNQDYKKYKIIIVNDGSTDNSLSSVENNYRDEIARKTIKIVNQSNQGVSVARNRGIEESKSDYICLLDADDEWRPDFLSKIVALINDYPDADLYSLAHMIRNKDGKLYRPKHGLPDHHRGYVEDFFRVSSQGSVANSSKVCVKKQAFLRFGGFPEGVVAGEDIYVWIRLALNGKVACDMNYLCIVNRQVDKSRNSRKNSVPYPLVFFSENKFVSRSKSLDKYLFVIFYKHFLNSLLGFKSKEAFIRLKAYKAIYI